MNEIKANLAERFLYNRYLIGKESNSKLLNGLKLPEFVALHGLHLKFADDDTLDRVYLKELAEEMDLPIPKTSEIVKALQAKGMVNWTFDGKGEDGTYVTITEKGERFLKDNKVYFEEFSEKIIERFGKERFEQFIGMMAEIEQITLEMRAEGV
ncbi:MAG: MarR family winged helix-turn-helix transcriptional regulator [Lachnospiraceae bacterium]|nr:MarR family winged helix-turn-helix transcriptional regulator [Lachnospiraceae bacterium]